MECPGNATYMTQGQVGFTSKQAPAVIAEGDEQYLATESPYDVAAGDNKRGSYIATESPYDRAASAKRGNAGDSYLTTMSPYDTGAEGPGGDKAQVCLQYPCPFRFISF